MAMCLLTVACAFRLNPPAGCRPDYGAQLALSRNISLRNALTLIEYIGFSARSVIAWGRSDDNISVTSSALVLSPPHCGGRKIAESRCSLDRNST
eukprot:scaffold243099_cov26-Tisochrysis_lutea.AAC.2